MSNTRILLVEDEYMIRLILSESLVDDGYSVVGVESGDEAVRILDAKHGFAAVVTDIHMPGAVDGIGVGQRTRKLEPLIPVVYVTGRPDSMNALGCLSPLEALVRKPFKPSQVLAALRQLLLLVPQQAAGPGSGGGVQ